MKRGMGLKTALIALGVCASASLFAALPSEQASAESATEISVASVESFDDGVLIVSLTDSDFMTADGWSYESVEALKWNNATTYETRKEGNVFNAPLQNFEAYNYAEYIYLDGVALSSYKHALYANYFQRTDGLGILFEDASVLQNATQIEVKAGCEIPSLLRCYFGQAEEESFVVGEDVYYKKHNGLWAQVRVFEGYDEGVKYDASDEYFYLRSPDGAFMGHTEAPTCEFTDIYAKEGTDEGYALASSPQTEAGNLLVYEFVNPIPAAQFGKINLRVHVFSPLRKLAAYNPHQITVESLGEPLEYAEATLGWSQISLFLPLYADENGMVDKIVLQFLNDGNANVAENQIFLAWFSLEAVDFVHEQSLTIRETDDAYALTFRFNYGGEWESDALDTTKVSLNGETLAEIAQNGGLKGAEWQLAGSIYQIYAEIDKDYAGAGRVKNAQMSFAANIVRIERGLVFPNGMMLEDTYVYEALRLFTDLVFETEIIVAKESAQTFEETSVEGVEWFIDTESNDNLRIVVTFDECITNSAYIHACEAESWRGNALSAFPDLYSEGKSKAFVAGGFKTALMNCVVINGKTIGDLHAENAWTTCCFVHYGTMSVYRMEIFVDSNAGNYAALRALLESGEGVTVEILKGLKFTTGYQTERNYEYRLQGGVFVSTDVPTISIFYDGVEVRDGSVVETAFAPSTDCIKIVGVDEYELSQVTTGNDTYFTVRLGGEEWMFIVRETAVEQTEQTGCGASALGGGWLAALAGVALVLRRRKHA